MLSTQLKSITDLRSNPLLVSQMASDMGPIYILNRNKPVSVMLDVETYEKIMDELQDVRDVAEINKLKKTTKASDFVPWEQVKKGMGL